jgi:hypothetical protein
MTILPKTPGQTLLSLFLIGAVNAGVAVSVLPTPPDTTAATAPEAPWELPKLPQVSEAAALQTRLRKKAPWGEEPASSSNTKNPADPDAHGANPETPKPVNWQFVGVIQEGGQSQMLALDEQKKLSRHRVGERLPDGSTLLNIAASQVEVKVAEQVTRLRLYDRRQVAAPTPSAPP